MIAVIIPAYKVKDQILDVVAGIGPETKKIYIVDDACPQGTGNYVKENCHDDRVEVIFHEKNQGVGGAVITGYRRALEEGCRIMVKLDGDGQMAPGLIPRLVAPILNREADYVKGNRFYDLRYLEKMPGIRRFGNSVVSFISKMATGYWNVMDPANGFTAISARALRDLPLERIDPGFFFENDLLFRLNTIRAVVKELPQRAEYGEEKSNISLGKIALRFPGLFLNRMIKRIFYSYFLRDFNIGTLELIMSFAFGAFGLIFGAVHWSRSIESQQPATAGTVLLAGLPIILSFQSFLAFLHYDVAHIPQKVLSDPDTDL